MDVKGDAGVESQGHFYLGDDFLRGQTPQDTMIAFLLSESRTKIFF